MSYATLCYVPPPRLHAESFVRNIRHYQTRWPVIWYGNCDSVPGMIAIPDPTNIKLSKNRVAIHNRIFLHGLEIAQKNKLKRFIYLEADSRVGCDFWDQEMFDEAEQYRDMFVCGSPSVYNSKAMTPKQSVAVQSYVKDYTDRTGWKVPVFEAQKQRPIGCVFIMGSVAVYNTDVMADLMMGFERDANQKAIKTPAFDLFVGMRCVQLFGINATKKLPFLTCSFSSYGSKINNESDRIEMLRTGKCIAAHQIKSSHECIWDSPDPKATSPSGKSVRLVVDG